MNEHFVCVKVDREERPDVDAIYMDAVQAMTGQGGWPLNAFLTPDGVPFFARHLLPAASRATGCRRWRDVLDGVCARVDEQRDEIDEAARHDRAAAAGRRVAARRPPDELDPAVAGRGGRDPAARSSTESTAAGAARRSSRRPR